MKTCSENDFLVLEPFLLVQFKKAFGSDLEYVESWTKLDGDRLKSGSAFHMYFMSNVLPIFQEKIHATGLRNSRTSNL